MLLAGPISHTSIRCMDFVEIFNIILDLSITCFSYFSGCSASFLLFFVVLVRLFPQGSKEYGKAVN